MAGTATTSRRGETRRSETRRDASTAGTDVRVLHPEDARAAAALLALGFDEEPGNLALYPDPATRRTVFEMGARNIVTATLPHGTVHGAFVDGELAAVSLWHPPGAATASVAGVLRSVAGKLANGPMVVRALPHAGSVILRGAPEAIGLARRRRRGVLEASEGTSWHLAFLATAPEHRGKGLARALLDRQLRRCDEDGLPVWLETTDPVNPPIYERFGFVVTTHIEDAAWLPGFWVMRREPREV